jgi:hypothetical protein
MDSRSSRWRLRGCNLEKRIWGNLSLLVSTGQIYT